ncbi:hypothetical protein ACFLTM_02120 [Candidatus Bipolaricaulota bacterium]
MTLKPGYPRKEETDSVAKWFLDEQALSESGALLGSMALKMEEQLAHVYELIKGEPMPADNAEDLRILLVGIARGVLLHLEEFGEGIEVEPSVLSDVGHIHDVTVSIDDGIVP